MPVELVWVRGRGGCQDHLPLPTDRDGALALSTLRDAFPGCCGLTFVHPETDATRGLRLKDGRLYPPSEGWGSFKYACNFPKETSPEPRSASPGSPASPPSPPLPPSPDRHKDATDLIVLGLPWRTTEQTVRDYFEAFGKVKKVWLKRDSKGQSKGFAFIRFANYRTQMKVLAKKHAIDGRRCDVLIPHSKRGLPFKVFVGGCTQDMTAEDLRDHFYKYGEVTDVFVPRPFRPFGFVTFLDPEMAQSVCEEPHVIKGVSVNVSIASPKHHQPKNGSLPIAPDRRHRPPAGPDRPDRFDRFDSPSFGGYDVDALNFRRLTLDDGGQNVDSYGRYGGDRDARGSVLNHNIWGNFSNVHREANAFANGGDFNANDGYGFASWPPQGPSGGVFDQWPVSADHQQMHS